MRRSPMPPRKAPIRRGSQIPRKNSARSKKLVEKQFGPKAVWIRKQPCATCARAPPSEASHARSRGAGGAAEHLIPQCRHCHQELHDRGVRTFETCHRENLMSLASKYEKRWKSVSAKALQTGTA